MLFKSAILLMILSIITNSSYINPIPFKNNASYQMQPITTSKPNYLETSKQISVILDQLMERGYDKRVRPNYGGPPVHVNVTMRILSISSVSEVNMDFTADFYFRQTWHDPRLAFLKINNLKTLYVGAEVSKRIWLPDTFFGNEKQAYFHEATTPNVFLRIDHTGEVYRSIRLTVTSSCPMNLQYFPMDRQRCTIEAESYGYGTNDIVYLWAKEEGKAVERDENISLPQFEIVKTVQKYRVEVLSSGSYSRLIAELHFQRRMGYYLIQIYIPGSLIVVISWVSFWLHRNASPARVQLGVTTVLTMTTLMSSTNAALPKVSYVKSIDIFLGFCFIMVFAALVEYATVGYLGKRIAMRKARLRNNLESQAQALEFAQFQAQGAQGDPIPLLSSSLLSSTNPTTITPASDATKTITINLAESSVLNRPHSLQRSICNPQPPARTSSASVFAKYYQNLDASKLIGDCSNGSQRIQFYNRKQTGHDHYNRNRNTSRVSDSKDDMSIGSSILCVDQTGMLSNRRPRISCHRDRSISDSSRARGEYRNSDPIPTSPIESFAAAAAKVVEANRRDKLQQSTTVSVDLPAFGTPPFNHDSPSKTFTETGPRGLNHEERINGDKIKSICGLRPASIDSYSRIVFPITFLCFQLTYWITLCHISAQDEIELNTK